MHFLIYVTDRPGDALSYQQLVAVFRPAVLLQLLNVAKQQ
jgi:hypothetical protein